jgi:hypothetical protein
MSYLDTLTECGWSSDVMNMKRKMAEDLKKFSKDNYLSLLKFNDKIKDENLSRLYNLKRFANLIKDEKLSEEDIERINELNDTIKQVNATYDDSFTDYYNEKEAFYDYELNNIHLGHVKILLDNFDKYISVKDLEFKLHDFDSSLQQIDFSVHPKIYYNKLNNAKNKYYDLKDVFSKIKESEIFQESELEALMKKEENLNEKSEKILGMLKREDKRLKRRKNYSLTGKVIGSILLIMSFLEMSKFYYENKTTIQDYFNNKVNPVMIKLKKDTIDKVF